MGKAGIGIMAAGVLRPQNMVKSKNYLNLCVNTDYCLWSCFGPRICKIFTSCTLRLHTFIRPDTHDSRRDFIDLRSYHLHSNNYSSSIISSHPSINFIHSFLCRPLSRLKRTGSWLCYWHRWRCGSKSFCSASQIIRRYDIDSYICRGPGTLWYDSGIVTVEPEWQ